MKRVMYFAALAYLGSAALPAQVNKRRLTGIVPDSSGAVVPGAAPRLANTGTGAERPETTGQNGLYRLMLLDLGMHRLVLLC
jgi:hypothetical protein